MTTFSDEMKELAVELTDEFSEGKTCIVRYGSKGYDSNSGLVTAGVTEVTVPRCMYNFSQSYFKKEDFTKASAILAVSGHYFNYEDVVSVGSTVHFSDGKSMSVCAKDFDANRVLFEFGLM